MLCMAHASRRAFIAIASGSLLRAARARAQSATAPANLFDIQKVTDGVYAAVAHPSAAINCNSAIFENANDLMIVDSHSHPAASAALVAQIRREVSAKPVRYVVNTHFHADHTLGNSALTEGAHAGIISSTATRGAIEAHAREMIAATPGYIDNYKSRLASARTPEEKAFFGRAVADLEAYQAEMRDFAPDLPNITFDTDLVIHDRAHDLHLAFRGRGHTGGDIVVHCLQKRVIATGDLAHGWLPYPGDGYPREWPRTLDAVGEFDFEHLIGGHGVPQRGKARMRQMRAFIEEATALIVRGKAEGRTVEELQKTITPATLSSISDGGYGEFVASSLFATGAVGPADTRAGLLADGVRSYIQHTWRALERS